MEGKPKPRLPTRDGECQRPERRIRIRVVTEADLHQPVDELPDTAVEGAGALLRGIIKGPIDPDHGWFWTPERQAKE